MIRTLSAAAGLMALTAMAQAAPQAERVRGTIVSADDTSFMVKMQDGTTKTVSLAPQTRFLYVVKSSLDNVSDGKFIGTATKGEPPVALEVVIFPESMKGTGEGHYDWDTIIDTTVGGSKGLTKSAMTNGTIKSSSGSGAMTKSAMTNGTVKAPGAGAMMTKSAMTNGTVKSGAGTGGGKSITVTYDNGKQLDITVPPTAPIVEFEPADKSIVKVGAVVFTSDLRDGDKLVARAVSVGKDGVTPPM